MVYPSQEVEWISLQFVDRPPLEDLNVPYSYSETNSSRRDLLCLREDLGAAVRSGPQGHVYVHSYNLLQLS